MNKMLRSATFSACRKYRYTLSRIWEPRGNCVGNFVMFIGLNPSTADEQKDDPTVKRCIRFARDWGYGGLIMTNIFAYRATDPAVMKAQDDKAVGPENNYWLSFTARGANIIVGAWGTHGAFRDRDSNVIGLINEIPRLIYCLGITKNGQPKHPLYLKANEKLRTLFCV
jgi:hypothetical protein